MKYPAYLRSLHWLETREEKLREIGYRCQGCDARERLHVHHLTYDRLGHERMRDLMVLCEFCHALEHGRPPPGGGPIAGLDVEDLTTIAHERGALERDQRHKRNFAMLRTYIENMRELTDAPDAGKDIAFMLRRVAKMERQMLAP